MARYRKKPVIIEAIQHDGSKESLAAILRLSNNIALLPEAPDGTCALAITTLEGIMTASPFDYIIRGVAGEVYPCRREIFEATYTRVEEEHDA